MVDQRAPVVGRGVRSPCSDSDESDDDVLSVGPMRPLLFATPLGGARGHDDDMIHANSLRDECSVDSWSAGDRYGTSCAQLDNFVWVMPAGYPVGVLPRLEEEDSLSNIEPDVCDVPNVFPIRRETAAVEPLCFPVVVSTRPQGGCDPVLPLPMGRGRDILAGDDSEVIVSGRESNVAESDVSREICVVSDKFPVVMPRLAVVPLAISVVAQTRPRVGRGQDLPLLVDEGRESLPEDGLDVILSGQESTVRMSDVSRGICVVSDQLPVVMPRLAAVPLAVSVVAQTRPRVCRGPDLPLLVDGGRESLPEDSMDVIISGRESTVRMSDVSRDICVEPELLPVVMSTHAIEALAVPVVTLTRSWVDGHLVVARPVNVDAISWAAVYPDLLSGRVMKSVDPDVRSGNLMSLKMIPGADGDACHSE